MKCKRGNIVIVLILVLCITIDVKAQRRTVVRTTPNRTVVRTTGHRIVYSKPIPIVGVLRTLPVNTVVVKRGGVHFHFHGGRYYRRIGIS